MSVCGEFAEHVWKPGSCKNCFHPRSAHTQADVVGGASGRASVGGDEDCGGVFPSPYSKPTIAVKPTMMNTMETAEDVNMNSDQSPKSPVGLKILDLSPFCMDSNGCSKALREVLLQAGVPGKRDNLGRLPPCPLPPTALPRPSAITGSVFVAKQEGLKENGSGAPCGPHVATTGTRESCVQGHAQRALFPERCEERLGSSVQEVQTTLGNGVSKEMSSALSSPAASPDSRNVSLSDSCSFGSSSDSLAGADVFHPCGPESPGDPSGWGSPSRGYPGRRVSSEPIYAESSKRKLRSQQHTEVNAEVSSTVESPRATITVVAAHTEENNRIFYLSSPDSAVSTQWQRFGPVTPDDPVGPAFSWPSTPSATETTTATTVAPSAQSSPPIPPKRSSRSPKLGASSLSPLPLPELNCPATLPPRATSSRSVQGDPQPSSPASTPVERRQKLHNTWSLEGRIEEEEEEGDGETRVALDGGLGDGPASSFNGPAVWESEASGRSSAGSSEPVPGAGTNNGTSQKQTGTRAQEGMRSVGVLGGDASHHAAFSTSSAQLPAAASADSTDTRPPPPPPKKHHRPCTKLSVSAMELDVLSQHGSVESLTHSVRGLHSCNTASCDSLPALSDSGAQDSSLRSCPSPFPSSPLASSPGSPHPDPFPSNSLGQQTQPPPLPEKKLVNRTSSAPGDAGARGVARTRPRLPFSGSESNVSRAEGVGLQCPQPCSPVEPRPFSASSDSLDGGRHPRCSRPLDEPQGKGRGRLGGHSRGSLTSCSSPQLSALAPSSAAAGGVAAGTGSTLQLHTLLSNMDSRECIYSKLGGLYAESLRRLALKCESHFTHSQRGTERFSESNWSLFKLTRNTACCLARDAVYYSASCASDVENAYAVKICKGQSAEARQAHLYGLSVQQSLPLHFNLQQDCGHFIACVPQSMLPGEETLAPPAGPSTPPPSPGPSTPSEHERVVVITREVPCQTAADFVREWAAFHRAQPEVYERRVCFLLLQLCSGLEHLKGHGVTHRDLCLENLLLVPHRYPAAAHADPQQQHLPRLLISNFSKAKQRSTDDSASSGDSARLRRDHARLAPEIVSAAQYRKFDEFQTGILMYEVLHQPNPFEVTPELREQDYRPEELPPIPALSIYSAGLQRLARLLLQPDPIKRIHIQEAKRGLQCLLWGPRRELMDQRAGTGGQPRQDSLLNWLDVKRALLMMKFAERSLEPERNAELEDWLCCQYLSTAHPLGLQHTAELLYGSRAVR